ncbi:MAG TPA: class I SAM-dependent methyltransferase [Blastocatellia bacterium]|jgi:ubiquinone/menaquinone biosynthesis C-methylase UbiE|nr:class I SAM-dependent methyltransferase [Blastocatellia bacterium]
MSHRLILIVLSLLLVPALAHLQVETDPAALRSPQQSTRDQKYETRAIHDPDGIGKFYMGREIAHVMGHEGAAWLERRERLETETPDEVVRQMRLKPTDVVADIGAGTGYFSFRLSKVVPQGKVYAVDIQPEMLAIIERRKGTLGTGNVVGVLGTEMDTKLPTQAVDVALLVDAYHEFSYPREMMESIVRSLKPGGRVVQVEYRAEDPDVPIKRLHKMSVDQARKEMAVVGLVWKETKAFLPQQHFLVYEKPK